MKSLYCADGINERGWERAMSKAPKRTRKPKVKPATVEVDALFAALRGAASDCFEKQPKHIAEIRARYADWPANSRRDEWIRDSINTDADYTWGQLLGIRSAVYSVRGLFGYSDPDWLRFDVLADEIDMAMKWVSKGARV